MAKKSRKSGDHEATSSAGTVASIVDLVIDILLRLPILSLLRFQLVSKQWKSLITSPEFLKMRSRNPGPAKGLFVPWTLLFPSLDHFSRGFDRISFNDSSSIHIPKLEENTHILQSCNGLLLCSTNVRPSSTCTSTYYIYNPTTKNSFNLPELYGKNELGMANIRSISLAFDPKRSPYYKVICVRQSKKVYYIYIYSSETGLWTSCPEQPGNLYVNCASGVYWNGGVFWIYAGSYFSIEDKILKAMPMPPVDGNRQNYYFGESCGHLYYTKMRTPKFCFEISIYELKSDYSGWILKYAVEHRRVMVSIKSVFSVVHGEKDEDFFLVLESEGKALRYNLLSESFHAQELHDFCAVAYGRAFQYIESLSFV